MIKQLVDTVSKGGNLLVDVGPTKEGTIPLLMQDRLQEMGKWLNVNGEAIYKTEPWRHFNDSTTHEFYYTQSKVEVNTIFGIFLNWPTDDMIVLSRPQPTQATQVHLLGFADDALNWDFTEDEQANNSAGGYMRIYLPSMAKMQHVKQAWALKITKCL